MAQAIADGDYSIKSVFAAILLHPSADIANAPIVLGQDDKTDSYLWTITCTDPQKNTYTIVNKQNSLYSYVGPNAPPLAIVVVNPTQQDFVIALAPGTTNAYTICTADSKAYWNVSSTDTDSNITLITTLSGTNQQFNIQKQGSGLENGHYRLTNVGVQLPVKPAADQEGSYIGTYVDDGTIRFQWQLTTVSPDVFTIRNLQNNLYIWCDNNAPANTMLTTNQQRKSFKIMSVPGQPPDIYQIQTEDTEKYLGIMDRTPESYIIVGDSGTADTYRWQITKV